jgi:hypothetical protein
MARSRILRRRRSFGRVSDTPPRFLELWNTHNWTEMMLNYNLTLSNDTIALYVANVRSQLLVLPYVLTDEILLGCGFRQLTQQPSPARVSGLFMRQRTHSTW